MVLCMRVGGKRIKPMELEDLFTPTVMFMMESGSMIKLMVMVYIAI